MDRDTLVREWPALYLPPVVRAAWEQAHPVLRSAARLHMYRGPEAWVSTRSRAELTRVASPETCTYFG